MVRYVEVFAVVLALAAPVGAQQSVGSVAGGFGLGQGVLSGDCRFGCGPLLKGFIGEGSVNLSDRVAIAGRVRVSLASVIATRDDVHFAADIRDVGVGGGIRVYGRRNNVRPFVQLMAELDNFDVGGELGGFSESGLAVSPGGGVEVDIRERVGLRVLGEWSSRRLGFERVNLVSAWVGIVLTLGRRCVSVAC